MRFTRILALAAAVCLLPVGLAAQTTHVVNQTGLTFVPDTLTIQAGDTVQWVWSAGAHTVTSGTACTPDGLFDLPLDSLAPIASFTFTSTGTYDYYCIPHCVLGMDGVITVTAPVPALPPWSLVALLVLAPAAAAFVLRRRAATA